MTLLNDNVVRPTYEAGWSRHVHLREVIGKCKYSRVNSKRYQYMYVFTLSTLDRKVNILLMISTYIQF